MPRARRAASCFGPWAPSWWCRQRLSAGGRRTAPASCGCRSCRIAPTGRTRSARPRAFKVFATRDGHPIALPSRHLEARPGDAGSDRGEDRAAPGRGTDREGDGPKQPGFVRLVATATFEGQDYRALGTAGFAPGQDRADRRPARRLRRLLERRQGRARQAAGGRQARADARVEQRQGRLLAREPAERRPRHDGHQPLLRRAVRAEGRRPVSGAAAGAGRGSARVPRRRRDGGEGNHHASRSASTACP